MSDREWEFLFTLLAKAARVSASEFLDRLAVSHSEEEYVTLREYIDKLAEDYVNEI